MIGKYRNRITYKEKTIGQGSFGEPVITWNDFATVWAKIDPIRGREYWDAEQVQSEVTHRIVHRYLSDVSPEMEIHFKGRVFDVLHFHDAEEKKREMEVLVKERL